MTAAILSIGTELTRGEIVNTNASWLCEQLTALGFEVTECTTVADDKVEINATLERLERTHGVIVCTGGLGPTTDDITSACVAELLNVTLMRDDAGLLELRERFTRAGRTFYESNIKQFDFPQGATILPNTEGTAPGFQIRIGSAHSYFMPGVPSEMKPMFERSVVPTLANLTRPGQHQIRFKTFSMPEAAVNELLAGVEERFGITIGYRAHFPEIEVKVLAKAAQQAEAERLARLGADEVRRRLGNILFGEGDITLAQSVGNTLRAKGLKLALAESCTGGLIGHLLCQQPSSDFFLGGVVCYANSIKQAVLGVDPALLQAKGAVSTEVAAQMAIGARQALAADVALAVTGIAGPTGGTPEKPVGLVHYAVATALGVTTHHTQFPRSRDQIRLHAAYSALWLLRRTLLASQK
jgi:nicotinamide-nucleotide amidase